uniref:Uncharacterized protein n=1 Tax=Anopheles dirus TaxID=7168 RepID=A0A182NVJ0_9DIPT
MGSEHSTQLQQATAAAGSADGTSGTLRTSSLHRHSTSAAVGYASAACGMAGRPATGSSGSAGGKLQRGNTIAVTGTTPAGGGGLLDDVYSSTSVTPSSAYICDSRPVSPPMSVCSDSDLPYISYTDKPIGDSPKLRNKQQAKQAKSRPNSAIIMNRASQQYHYPQHLSQQLEGRGGSGVGGRGRSATTPSTSGGAHSIVVVKSAIARDIGIEKDDDIVRLQLVVVGLVQVVLLAAEPVVRPAGPARLAGGSPCTAVHGGRWRGAVVVELDLRLQRAEPLRSGRLACLLFGLLAQELCDPQPLVLLGALELPERRPHAVVELDVRFGVLRMAFPCHRLPVCLGLATPVVGGW